MPPKKIDSYKSKTGRTMPNIDARRERALNVYTFCKEEAARQCYKFPVSQPRERASAMTRIPAGNLFLSLSLSLSLSLFLSLSLSLTHTHTHRDRKNVGANATLAPGTMACFVCKIYNGFCKPFLMKMFTYETDMSRDTR